MVGGCAGDGLKMTRTFQFHGDHVLTDSVITAGSAPPARSGSACSTAGARSASQCS